MTLIVLIGRLLVARRDAPAPAPRTEAEKAQDKRTALVWGALLLAVPMLLLAAYAISR